MADPMLEGTLDDDLVRRQLRADLADDHLVAPPGEDVEVRLHVMNTSEVIETLRVSLLGLMAEEVRIEPREVTLFPGEDADVTLHLRFHRTLPTGSHDGLVVVAGHSGSVAPAEARLRIDVPAQPSLELAAEPPVRTGGRKGEFEVLLGNRGNTPLDLQLRAADANRQLALRFDTSALRLPVDHTDGLRLRAVGKRPWTGAPVEHVITVQAEGESASESVEVRFRQKPRLTAGVITILTLLLIVALWAAAMVFGVQAALAPAPPTKVVPEGFVEGVGLADLDPLVVGGGFTGTIRAGSTAQPLARVTVEAYDRNGRLVAATATDDNGVFVLEGLLPVRHRLRILSPGFDEQWWPGAPDARGARALLATPNQVVPGLDLALPGRPAELGGRAIAGDGTPATITVEVQPVDLLGDTTVRRVTADSTGTWSLAGLPAPATYRITYRAEGYAPVELSQPVEAGLQSLVNTTRLPAAAGSISGVVRDSLGRPLGGVAVLAQGGESAFELTTPTSGAVGTFTLADLTTPATYLLTFIGDGLASETTAVRLGPGEFVEDLSVVLGPATGTVVGHVLDPDGGPLGGVTVTVTGGGVVLTSETLTSGDVGGYRLTGLPLPGTYAVTFDLLDHARQTTRVVLEGGASTATADVVMAPSVGAVTGMVLDEATGLPVGAATVTISDGLTTRTTTTASVPATQRGRFHLGGLRPGTYTVTALAPEGGAVTVLHTVTAPSTGPLVLRIPSLP